MRQPLSLARAVAIALWGVSSCAWPLWAAGPIAPEIPAPIYTRQWAFSIPFKIEEPAPGGVQPQGVQLHVSEDLGRSWRMADQAAATAQHFSFRAQRDGEYWFFVRTLDQQGQLQPVAPPAPELRVVVDTLAPRLKLQNQLGGGGEITATWQLLDQSLDADSFLLEFQPADSNSWQTVNTPRAHRADQHVVDGQVTWWPGTSTGKIQVRATVADRAGNSAVSQVELDLDRRVASPVSAPGQSGQQLVSNRRTETLPQPASAGQRPGSASTPAAPGGGVWQPDRSAQQPFRPDSLPGTDISPSTDQATSPPARAADAAEVVAAPPPSETIPPGIPVEPIAGEAMANSPGRTDRVGRPVSTEAAPGVRLEDARRDAAFEDLPEAETLPPGNEQPAPGEVMPQSALTFGDVTVPEGAATKFVNALRFELEYEVELVGAAGIGRVELWGTSDGGRTWETYGVDPDNRTPFVVTVDREALYGFAIVVESGAGLGGLPPRSGDTAEVWVGVDLTKPQVNLLGIEQGAGDRAGEITIRWEATDALLGARPVSLAFRDAAGGEWATFASGLQNTGQHQWQIDRRVPERIYLRVEVRDAAGNVAVADSFEPISLDRVRPQGRIRDVRPARESNDGARIERTIWR